MTKIRYAITFLLIIGTLTVCIAQKYSVRVFTTTIANDINGQKAKVLSCDVMTYVSIDQFTIYLYAVKYDGSAPDFDTKPNYIYHYTKVSDLVTGSNDLGFFFEALYKIRRDGNEFYRKLRFYHLNNIIEEIDTTKSTSAFYLTDIGLEKIEKTTYGNLSNTK